MQLNEVEQRLGLTLPLDLRCAYRIHNGQKIHGSCPARMPVPYGYFERFLRVFSSNFTSEFCVYVFKYNLYRVRPTPVLHSCMVAVCVFVEERPLLFFKTSATHFPVNIMH